MEALAIRLVRPATDESSSFFNGLLGRILDLRPRLSIEAEPPVAAT